MASYDDTATVSGTVVSIENGADEVGAKSCVVTVPPTLTGTSLVSETQIEGKDYLNGATVVQGGFNINNGNNYASTNRLRTDNYIAITSGSYTIENYQSYEYVVYVYDETNAFIDAESIKTWQTYGTAFSISGNRHIRIGWRKSDNSTITADEISGYHCYKVGTKTTYTASLGRTIYGGTADIVNGTGTDNTTRIQIKDRTWTITEVGTSFKVFTCDKITTKELNFNFQVEGYVNAETYRNYLQDKQCGTYNTTNAMDRIVIRDDSYTTVEDFLTAVGDNYIVFENTAPTDFTFDGQEIPTRLGYNAFWSEQGDTELTYYKSGYGFTSVTVNKNGVSQTAKLHKVIYGGQADVVKGTCEPKNMLKNLGTFPYSLSENGYYLDFTSIHPTRKIPVFRLQADVDYTLSCDVNCDLEPFNFSVGHGSTGAYQRDIKTVYNKTNGRVSISFSVTQSTLDTYGDIFAFRVPRYGTVKTFNVTVDNVQLEIGDTASDFAPYFDPFTFPPISMETDEGENTLFANEGDSAITYRKAVD